MLRLRHTPTKGIPCWEPHKEFSSAQARIQQDALVSRFDSGAGAALPGQWWWRSRNRSRRQSLWQRRWWRLRGYGGTGAAGSQYFQDAQRPVRIRPGNAPSHRDSGGHAPSAAAAGNVLRRFLRGSADHQAQRCPSCRLRLQSYERTARPGHHALSALSDERRVRVASRTGCQVHTRLQLQATGVQGEGADPGHGAGSCRCLDEQGEERGSDVAVRDGHRHRRLLLCQVVSCVTD